MNTAYIAWLRGTGTPLYKVRDTYWTLYHKGLIPASAAPTFVEVTCSEAKGLLRESGAWFLHYASDPCEVKTEWWYVVCQEYHPEQLSSNTRSKINRGNRHCSVARVEAEWLAEHGYTCYVLAHRRYKNATPASQERFRNHVLRTRGGPFEFWAVFVGKKLAGYCQTIIEINDVATTVIKFDPTYLTRYTSYALISGLVNHYVVERGMILNNGTRSLAHDTNIQEFLLKLGFKKRYCRLNLVYHPLLSLGVRIAFPFRNLLPDHRLSYKIRALLFQEELRRLWR